MTNYVFAFHGGNMPETQEERDAVMAKWGTWMGGMGDALVNPGAPVGMSTTVHADRVENNGGANPLSGYTVVEAASMDAAVEMAKECPILEHGGSVEIAEAMSM
jgi:hypothetical protein